MIICRLHGKFVDMNTYSTLNGLLKNKNDSAIVTALRAVVTVAASVAPHVRTNVNTNWIPK